MAARGKGGIGWQALGSVAGAVAALVALCTFVVPKIFPDETPPDPTKQAREEAEQARTEWESLRAADTDRSRAAGAAFGEAKRLAREGRHADAKRAYGRASKGYRQAIDGLRSRARASLERVNRALEELERGEADLTGLLKEAAERHVFSVSAQSDFRDAVAKGEGHLRKKEYVDAELSFGEALRKLKGLEEWFAEASKVVAAWIELENDYEKHQGMAREWALVERALKDCRSVLLVSRDTHTALQRVQDGSQCLAALRARRSAVTARDDFEDYVPRPDGWHDVAPSGATALESFNAAAGFVEQKAWQLGREWFEKADQEFARAHRIAKENLTERLQRARALHRQGQFQKAMEVLAPLVEAEVPETEVSRLHSGMKIEAELKSRFAAAEALARDGEWKDAAEAYLDVAKLRPEDTRWKAMVVRLVQEHGLTADNAETASGILDRVLSLAAGFTEAEELRGRVEDLLRPPEPKPDPEPQPGSQEEIEKLLGQAEPGTQVVLQRSYKLTRTLTLRDVELVGGEGGVTLRIDTHVGSAVRIVATSAVIRNVTFVDTGSGDRAHPLVWINDSKVTVARCVVKGGRGNGIEIRGDGEVLVEDCMVDGCRLNGIVVEGEKNKVTIRKCKLKGNGRLVGPRAKPLEGQGAGIELRGGAKARVEENECWKNTWGIRVQGDKTEPVIQGNELHDNIAGIKFRDKADGTVEGNHATHNRHGFHIFRSEGCHPRLRHNNTKGNLVHGVNYD